MIAKRHNIEKQNIPMHNIERLSISDVPEYIKTSINIRHNTIITPNLTQGSIEQNKDNNISIFSSNMIIDILNNLVLTQLPMHQENMNYLNNDQKITISDLSFKAMISKFTLDFKQSVAFEIMACSFIIKSLNLEKITTDNLNTKMKEIVGDKNTDINCLSKLIKTMKQKGGDDKLVMFLSGMGGTGKSEVIKAFVHFAKGISFAFGWNYDDNVIKITAMTGAAACQIPNGKTLHSQACLLSRQIKQKHKEFWNSTKMLIIDEVSFLDEDNLKN